MGLDMYAVRRIYVKNWDHTPEDEKYQVTLVRGGKPVKGFHRNLVKSLEEQVMYWRKANHIHKWFVDNVQDGKDDCNGYDVSQDQLAELLQVCEKVIAA